MLNLKNAKKIAALAVVAAGFVILPLTALAAPVVTIQSTAVLNGSNSITYHIVVRNTGDQVATDVFVRNTLASNETFTSSTPIPATSSTQNSRMTVIWTPGTLNPGDMYEISLTTTVNGNYPSGVAVSDAYQVDGSNFATQSGTTNITTGPITTASPSTSVTPSPTPQPSVLPITGTSFPILMLILAGGLAAGALVSRLSLKNS